MPLFRRVAPALVAALALPAVAQEIPVTVLPYAPLYGGLPQSSGDRTAELIVSELNANGEFKAKVAAGEKAAGATAKGEAEIAAAKKGVAAAVALIDKATTLYKQRKMKLAADNFQRGIDRFLANYQGADDFSALSNAYLGLAMTRFRMGDESEAYKRVDDVVRLDPARTLDGEEFPKGTKIPPLFVKIHEKARAAYFEKARGQVRITTTPAGAVVLFDGRELGETPLLAKSVLEGDHYVRVVKPGAGAFWQKITVAGGEEVQLTSNLVGESTGPLATIAKGLSNNSLTPETATTVKVLGAKDGAKWVLFGTYRQRDTDIEVKNWLLRVEDGAVVQLTDLVFDIEMLGAAIEVFKLANDVVEKVVDFQGVGVQSELVAFPGASAPRTAEAFTEVVVTGGSAGAKGGVEEDRGGRRGPVRSVVGVKKTPIEAPKVEETTTPEEESRPRRLRVRGKIGETDQSAAQPATQEAPDEVTVEEVGTRAKVDLTPKPTGREMAALDPEELARLQRVEEDKKSGGAGKVLLWSGVGVVGAGAVATGLYFLLSSSAPTSATAHVTWSP